MPFGSWKHRALMGKAAFILYLILTVFTAVGQTCVYTSLSQSLLFKTQLTRLKRSDGYDSCRLRITVVTKLRHQTIFTTAFASGLLLSSAYAQCSAGRSYTTNADQGADILDYDYGDLVVADFNFDGKEDFAAKNDSGGNRGPTYNFYRQTARGSFALDSFLTEQMGHFPDRIDNSAKMLVLESDNGRWWFKTSYRLNKTSGRWQVTKRTGTHKSPKGN